MDAEPREGGGSWRVQGAWKGVKCRVSIDEARDAMSIEAACNAGDAAVKFGDPNDPEVLDKVHLKVRLHIIEVLKNGRGTMEIADGKLQVKITRAGLDGEDPEREAAVRMDVVTDLAEFLPAALR